MKISEIKNLINFLKDLDFDTDQFKEVHLKMGVEMDDFEVNDYRFIHKDSIDQIQVEELKSDLYILGCFNDWFLADCSNVPLKVIQALQKADCYKELGELMLEHAEEIQESYASTDGYGHHFAHYDGNGLEIGNYFVFRLN